jgi:hypothetical protein
MFERRVEVQVGYAKHKAYGDPRARKHVVVQDVDGFWRTRCTGKPATREYKGWHTTITCQDCKALIAEELK